MNGRAQGMAVLQPWPWASMPLRARAPCVAPIRPPPSPHAAAYRVFVRSNCVPNVLNAWSTTNEYYGARVCNIYGLPGMFSRAMPMQACSALLHMCFQNLHAHGSSFPWRP